MCLGFFFEGNCIVDYAFKVTTNDFFITYNGYLLIIIINIDLTVCNIEDVKQTNTEHYWTID